MRPLRHSQASLEAPASLHPAPDEEYWATAAPRARCGSPTVAASLRTVVVRSASAECRSCAGRRACVDARAGLLHDATYDPRIYAVGRMRAHRAVVRLVRRFTTWPSVCPAPDCAAVFAYTGRRPHPLRYRCDVVSGEKSRAAPGPRRSVTFECPSSSIASSCCATPWPGASWSPSWTRVVHELIESRRV